MEAVEPLVFCYATSNSSIFVYLCLVFDINMHVFQQLKEKKYINGANGNEVRAIIKNDYNNSFRALNDKLLSTLSFLIIYRCKIKNW